MRDIKNIFKFIGLSFFIILLIGGILAELKIVENTPSWAPNLFMIIGSLFILIFSKGKLLYFLFFIGILGFFYEVLGVKIGILFGSYNYTNVFNIKLFSVPLVMISAWIIIVNFSLTFIQNIRNKFFIIYGSLIMVIIDLVIDPIAVHGLKIWTWDEKGPYFDIPTHNFLGWFFLSLPIFALLYFSKIEVEKSSRLISNLVICFFSIVGFINEIYFPSVLGVLLVMLNFLFFLKGREIKSNAI
jgi:putative membrane protein